LPTSRGREEWRERHEGKARKKNGKWTRKEEAKGERRAESIEMGRTNYEGERQDPPNRIHTERKSEDTRMAGATCLCD